MFLAIVYETYPGLEIFPTLLIPELCTCLPASLASPRFRAFNNLCSLSMCTKSTLPGKQGQNFLSASNLRTSAIPEFYYLHLYGCALVGRTVHSSASSIDVRCAP